MVAWAVMNMGGEVPKTDPTLLPDNAAAAAWNCDLMAGPLDGLHYPERVRDFPDWTQFPVKMAFRVPAPVPWPYAPIPVVDGWLPLPSPYSSAVLSPLANDSFHRVYWTNPPDSPQPGAHWVPFPIIGNNAYQPFDLGFIAPVPDAALVVQSVGGTTGPPEIVRSYTYTLIDDYGNESSPQAPSIPVSGLPDAAWSVIYLPYPGAPFEPQPVAGKNYTPFAKIRLYRTITGTSGQTNFYMVRDFLWSDIVANPGLVNPSYADTALDSDIVGGLTLSTTGFAPAPDNLDGLTGMPGGFFVGFTGNTVHFSEPFHPHAWPGTYDLPVRDAIVALALWNQTLMIFTAGFPRTGTGTAPANFSVSEVQVNEPCIARGSVVVDLLGAYYASGNGLVQLTYFGMSNQTLPLISRPQWLTRFISPGPDSAPSSGPGVGGRSGFLTPGELSACRHRAQYIALRNPQDADNKAAWIVDYADQRLGVVWTEMLRRATALWNDRGSGETLYAVDGVVYRWDPPDGVSMPYYWRSKTFNLVLPVNLAACEITVDSSLLAPAPAPPSDPQLVSSVPLPDGVNAVFTLLVNDQRRFSFTLRDAPVCTFRLPSGYKAQQFAFEITARVPVRKVKLATSMAELNTV